MQEYTLDLGAVEPPDAAALQMRNAAGVGSGLQPRHRNAASAVCCHRLMFWPLWCDARGAFFLEAAYPPWWATSSRPTVIDLVLASIALSSWRMQATDSAS